VASWLALTEPRRVAGLHLNYIPGSYRPSLEGGPPLREDERGFLRDADRWYAEEGGYHHQQSTMPLTVGYGLTDSPVGLAAWILEKVERWSDCDGNLETRFTLDELLDNVMVYWISGTAYPAGRLYAEAAADPFSLGPGERVERPTGVLRLAKEAPFPPRSYVERGYRVVRWTEVDRGGHFAAWEEPEAFVADVRAFFRPLRH
jgi:pimeloyl-ACP methyl ester carboxylesterase